MKCALVGILLRLYIARAGASLSDTYTCYADKVSKYRERDEEKGASERDLTSYYGCLVSSCFFLFLCSLTRNERSNRSADLMKL